jgi:RecA/RadA recombinase
MADFSLNNLMEDANSRLGKGTVIVGSDLKRDPPRLPFGVFAVDYATGGGAPIWGSTCLWGVDAGGKTSLAINAVASVARICWRCFKYLDFCECSTSPLRLKAFWGDAEGTFDRDWALSIGASPDDYYYALADYGEMYINLMEKALQADDCGLVVADSLAALTPVAEFEAASEDQQIGMQARMISKAVRTLKQRIIRERKREHPVCVIFTNQMRTKIGTMYGDPSTMPGGHALRHEFSLLLRIVQKSLTDSDKKRYVGRFKDKPPALRHSFAIKKEKVLTLSSMGEFVRVREEVAGLHAGEVDDYTVVANYAKTLELLHQTKEGWTCLGVHGKRLVDLQETWRNTPDEYLKLKQEIIIRAKRRLADARS